jgi:purine nucleosidase
MTTDDRESPVKKLSSYRLYLLAGVLFPFPASAADRPVAAWPPPAGPLRVVIDADAANEVDDQWAIALALGFPERLRIEGFVAAHYGLRGGAKGVQKSYDMLLRELDAAGMAGRYPVRKGSDPLAYRDRVPESEGVDFIIERAKAATPAAPLWVVALGPATDAAAAVLKDPSIADRVVVLWHGRTEWPKRCWNFNAYNDAKAAQVLFDTPVRFVLFDTGEGLTMPMDESERRVGAAGPLGQFLHDIRKPSAYARRADKGMFDLGDIAALVDPRTVTAEVADAPTVGHDLGYDFTKPNGKLVRIHKIDRDATFALLDEALKRVAAGK